MQFLRYKIYNRCPRVISASETEKFYRGEFHRVIISRENGATRDRICQLTSNAIIFRRRRI